MQQKASDTKNINPTITLTDVAAYAGVSRSTVSLVLRKSPLVSDATRERVARAIKETGYVYNRGAASLRTQKTNSIGLIVADIKNPFYAELIQGVELIADDTGYSILIGSSSDDIKRQEKILYTMMEHNVDGLLFCPSSGTTENMLRMINDAKIPCVFVARFIGDMKMDYVGVNNLAGMKAVMQHLIKNGHTKIAFIANNVESSINDERLEGYDEMVAKYNLDVEDYMRTSCEMSIEGGQQTAVALMQNDVKPTAIVSYNDIVACGVMLGLASIGYTPGKDIAVFGADNMDIASHWNPSISTLSTRPREAGCEAIKLLIKRINNGQDSSSQILLTPELIIRQSSEYIVE